ncbi:MAG: NADH:ubiquinone reductase (Na(+)-transporting) subunit C [Bacteroidota bacterium]
MHSTNYVITFILIITTVVAVGLTGLREATKPLADANEALFNKKGVLNAIQSKFKDDMPKDWDDAKVEEVFAKVEGMVFDHEGNPMDGYTAIDLEKDRDKVNKLPVEERPFPVWVYEDEGKKYYVISVYGKGLWDKIWGTVAFEEDMNTLAGAYFDHKGETPGLGAEIKDNAGWYKQFMGKKTLSEVGQILGVKVMKGGAKNIEYEVDAISGATITCDGVTDMMVEGINNYQPIFAQLKNN